MARTMPLWLGTRCCTFITRRTWRKNAWCTEAGQFLGAEGTGAKLFHKKNKRHRSWIKNPPRPKVPLFYRLRLLQSTNSLRMVGRPGDWQDLGLVNIGEVRRCHSSSSFDNLLCGSRLRKRDLLPLRARGVCQANSAWSGFQCPIWLKKFIFLLRDSKKQGKDFDCFDFVIPPIRLYFVSDQELNFFI